MIGAMGGWETTTAIIGVATVIGSSWAAIYKHNRPRVNAETEGGMEGRIIKLEGNVAHILQAQAQLHEDYREHQDRQERVVGSMFSAINEIRRDVMDILKEMRK